MNYNPINPYQIIKSLQEELEKLKNENEELKKELENESMARRSDG